MTTRDVIKHWRKGAKSAPEAARLLDSEMAVEKGEFVLLVFREKALKAAIVEKTSKPHPEVHNLSRLALLLRDDWSAGACLASRLGRRPEASTTAWPRRPFAPAACG